MIRLHRFGSLVMPGPMMPATAHIVLDWYTVLSVNGAKMICVTPEMGSVEEINWHILHLCDDLKATGAKMITRFIAQQNTPFDPFSHDPRRRG